MALYLGHDLVGNIYVGTAAGGIASVTLNNPTITVSNTGLITAQVTQSTEGIIAANSTASSTQQLSTVNSTTITPTGTSQTAVAANKYTLGAITIAAVPTETKNIISNGTYTPSTGKWFSSITVNVPTGSSINNQDKVITPSTSLQTITADSGYTGLGTVTINAIPSNYVIPTGTLNITSNGTKDVTNYASVNINVQSSGVTINNQDKEITPSESSQLVTADTGYTGLGIITVNAISSTYVGSGIDRRTSSDVDAGQVAGEYRVAIPSGYYESSVTKYVPFGSATTPATTITVNPSISVNSSGLITATASASQSVTPTVSAGYIRNGTAGTITVSGSNTSQLTTQAAQTIYPSASDQSIASGRYLTGAQTIKGVIIANLSAENIKSGVTITVGDSADADRITSVTGTYSGSGGSSKNVQVAQSTTRVASTTYTKTASLTCTTTGTYDVYWDCSRSTTSGTTGSQLYIDGSSYGTANTTFSTHIQNNHLTGVSISANQEVAVYARSRGTNYYAYCGQLTIVQTA